MLLVQPHSFSKERREVEETYLLVGWRKELWGSSKET